VLGIIVFTPMILHLAERRHRGDNPSLMSSLGWFLLITGIVLLGFANRTTAHTSLYPVAYLSFPILVWLALSVRHDVTVAVALVTTMVSAFTSLGHGPLIRYDSMATYGELTVFIIVFSITCLLIMATEAERMKAAESALENRIAAIRSELENRAIRASLNPHFLFNSLNVIKFLIGQDEAKARDAVVSLSQLLRSSLRITRRDEIPLWEEISTIRSYIDLQKLRYENRLSASLAVDPSAEGVSVPPMLFHQLVENAFKHGIDPAPGKSELVIRAELTEGELFLSVSNTGILKTQSPDSMGLRFIREQLLSLYGKAASFTIQQVERNRVLALVTIPANRSS
jgi:sensor histidine kinase YesM